MKDNDTTSSLSLGHVIRQRRLELGLTQEELAERVGPNVRQSEISRLERDYISLPRRGRLEALARALDVTPGYLLMRSGWIEEDESPPPPPAPGRMVPEPPMRDVEPVPDGDITVDARPEPDGENELQQALARARALSRHTGEILQDSLIAIERARRSRHTPE